MSAFEVIGWFRDVFARRCEAHRRSDGREGMVHQRSVWERLSTARWSGGEGQNSAFRRHRITQSVRLASSGTTLCMPSLLPPRHCSSPSRQHRFFTPPSHTLCPLWGCPGFGVELRPAGDVQRKNLVQSHSGEFGVHVFLGFGVGVGGLGFGVWVL